MQLLVLALVAGLMIHEAYVDPHQTVPPPLMVLLLVLIPKIAMAAMYWLLCRITYRRLAHHGGLRTLHWLDRMGVFYRLLALALYGLDLHAGLLAWIRHGLNIHNWILVDELLVMLPTLLLIVWAWWSFYPIDRRLREATLMSRLDAGRSVYPIWTRGQYLLAQIRHQIAIMLVPMLLLLGWSEFVSRMMPRTSSLLAEHTHSVITFAGAACVLLFAPVMIRHMWDTVPLPVGEVRDRLLEMCREHRVRVGQLLLWRTFGGMVNAAVMGVVAPLRYILLTDALLDMLPAKQVEAVMAHEIAHVRRKHFFWLLMAGFALLCSLTMCSDVLLRMLAQAMPHSTVDLAYQTLGPDAPQYVILMLTIIGWLVGFGWVSRRFERQADTFAVQHLTRSNARQQGRNDAAVPVDNDAVRTMTDALEQVAVLNHMSTRAKSWRHGSILWRQNHLRTLLGQQIDQLPIDRQVRAINLASLLIVASFVLIEYVLPQP